MSRRSKRAVAALGGGERAGLLHRGLREVEAHHLIAPLREQARIVPAAASRHRHARARRIARAGRRRPATRQPRRTALAELPAVLALGVELLPECRLAYGLAIESHASPSKSSTTRSAPAAQQLRLVVGGGHADGAHARRARGVDPHHRVLEDDAAGGIGVEAPGGEDVDLRVGLAEAHVVGRHHHREVPEQPEPGQDIVHVPARGRGAHRRAARRAARGRPRRSARPATARMPWREKPHVEVALAPGEAIRLPVGHARARGGAGWPPRWAGRW